MTEDGFGREDLGLLSGEADVIVLADGRTMRTHGPAICLGPNCCIHRPSQHPLDTAPLTWLGEIKMMFRVCPHQGIHPDPDSLQFRMMISLIRREMPYDGYHPCCENRCCEERDSDD